MGVGVRQGISILEKLEKHEMSPNIEWSIKEGLVMSNISSTKSENG